jgi:hypothetical protein
MLNISYCLDPRVSRVVNAPEFTPSNKKPDIQYSGSKTLTFMTNPLPVNSF